MADHTAPRASFDEQLILFRYFLHEFGVNSLGELSRALNRAELEGETESGGTYFCEYLLRLCGRTGAVPPEKLRLYDEDICRHTRRIGERRGGIRWKYFQYLALLFTERYLDRYFSDAEGFCRDLNVWMQEKSREARGGIAFSPYTPERLNRLAFMCATGSGKTLLMHVHILQYLHYFGRARQRNSRLSLNRVIVLAPNEAMSRQHLEELACSSIPASLFEKGGSFLAAREQVLVIDMNKLKEEGRVKTVSVDSFEQNNLVLIDEGHRGLSGDVWYAYRSKLYRDGFAFEYSATFKQALNPNAAGNTQKAREERALMEEYGKSILMDYSYKYFYRDGFGKNYRIYNLQSSVDEEQRQLYLTGCLLAFYQQLKLFAVKRSELLDFQIEQPLLVFVGNRVTSPVRGRGRTQAEKELLTDVEEVLVFLNTFLREREKAIRRIRAVLEEDTGLIDRRGGELFYQDFQALHEIFGGQPEAEAVFADMLHTVFNTDANADAPRLRLENLRQVPGEIGLKVGEYSTFFGVISIGDTAGLLKNCERRGIIVNTEEFVSESLFRGINAPDSEIRMLIGSRKFTEGWNSWRVSTIGLINFAKGEGAQAIQLFGRGVRLKGYGGCLKRSDMLDVRVERPKFMDVLETLTIFGVKAQYMEEFKRYLEQEGAPVNEGARVVHLKTAVRQDVLLERTLYTIRLKEGANFRQQARRMTLCAPDEGFWRYLLKNRVVIDCRTRIQTIDSGFRFSLDSQPEERTIPEEALPLLDWMRILEQLERYKREKRYYSIGLDAAQLADILRRGGWYGLLVPANYLKITSFEDLDTAADCAVLVLRAYLDRFFRYEKARWEAPRLEYRPLTADDRNFVDEYVIRYQPRAAEDLTVQALEAFAAEASGQLPANGGLGETGKRTFRDRLVLLDFPGHLYAPLVGLEKSNLPLQVTPAALNRDELRFVEDLRTYVGTHARELNGKSLWLLRNQSKTGLGFFEAGNFYPDFLLWIDTPEKQYLSFIDPKGLVFVRPDDPKVQFYQTVKALEARLAPTAAKPVVLNSFLLSGTRPADLRMLWSTPEVDADRTYREARNVYALDDPDYLARMIAKILS